MSAMRTFGASNSRANQRCGVIRSFSLPRATSIPISQAVMGEM
jgi:hypothetical protein